MNVRCVGSIIQRDKITQIYKAVLIFEDEQWRYTFVMETRSKVKASIWIDNNTNQMPQYYDTHTKKSLSY